MILAPHIIAGAVIGAKTQNLGLIVILGLIIHFIMDWIPHWDYAIFKNLRNFQKTKKIKYFISPFIKASIDSTIGLLIVFIVWQKNLFDFLPFILLGIFFSWLPDIVNGFILVFAKDKFNKKYFKFHKKYLHYPENKQKEGKITFLGATTQIIIIIISCVLLLYL